MQGNEDNGIDFVIAWVDGSDPLWLAEKARYSREEDGGPQNGEERYRDWGLLRYWFRSVELYCPWVRTIHLVTWGHLPGWLDTSNPRLHVVRHADYIPGRFLPTFSSHVIELNMHRIAGLSERFVYFNDDTFVNRPSRERDFFRHGLPVDVAALNVHCYSLSKPINLIATRDVGLVNEHFAFRDAVRREWRKWLSPVNGRLLARTLPLLGCPRFPGFYTPHVAQPFLKESFREVWEAEARLLELTCSHRFRAATDVNQWAVREWQLASGRFHPRRASEVGRYLLDDPPGARTIADRASDEIRRRRRRLICINDTQLPEEDFRYCRNVISEALKNALPRKSSYEK